MFGGSFGLGTVFKITKTGQEILLHSFSGPPDGEQPEAGFVRDANGNLYGTTAYGGDPNCNPADGCGTVFKLDTTDSETVLWSFTGSPDGFEPYAGVVLDSAGNLCGVTEYGGATNLGIVFEITMPRIAVSGSPLQPLTQDDQGNYVAAVTVTNNGNIAIDSLDVTIAGTILGTGSLLSSPAPVTNLAPGASATVTLKFPLDSVSAGATTAPLHVSGTYTSTSILLKGGNWALSFRGVSL